MQAIQTADAPSAIGVYSQAIKIGKTVYISGQIPLEPDTMQLCSSDIKLQIVQVLENVSAICEASGGNLSNIVKLTVYLTELSHFPLVNEAMSRYFSAPYPARAVIGISALPRDAKVEMDAIMVLSNE
jgi:reactive intermediate/imine deaminase